MSRRQIVMVADLAAVFFAKDELKEMGLKPGDEVEVTFEDNQIIVRSAIDKELVQMINYLSEQLFERRHAAYQQL